MLRRNGTSGGGLRDPVPGQDGRWVDLVVWGHESVISGHEGLCKGGGVGLGGSKVGRYYQVWGKPNTDPPHLPSSFMAWRPPHARWQSRHHESAISRKCVYNFILLKMCSQYMKIIVHIKLWNFKHILRMIYTNIDIHILHSCTTFCISVLKNCTNM